MSNNGSKVTKADLMEQHFSDQETIGDILEEHSEFAGEVNEILTDASQAVMHALKLARGLGDGTGACGSCLADDLRSIVYALESADRSIDVAGNMTAQVDFEFGDVEVDEEIGSLNRIIMQASEAGKSFYDAEFLANSDITDAGLNILLGMHPENIRWVTMIQTEVERRAGLRQ